MPPTNFEAFMYTASRALACEKKGSFSDARTTSPHMLEYLRYDMPAMRQYACEARGRIFFLVSGATFANLQHGGNGVCKHEEPGGREVARGDRRRGGREAAGSIPGARGGGSRASRPFADAGKPGGDLRNAPRLPIEPRTSLVVPVVDGALPV